MKLKSLLTNGALVLFAVLVFVFMSQAYATVGAGFYSSAANGYDMIDFIGDSKADFLAVSNIFVLVVAGLLAVAAIINILVACGVIKNEKLAKVMKVVTLALTIALAVFALLAMIMDIVNINDANKLMGVDAMKLGWAVIVNLVLAVLAVVVAVLQKVFKK